MRTVLPLLFLLGCSSSMPPDAGPGGDAGCATDACGQIELVWDAQGASLGCALPAFVCPDLIGSNICCDPRAVQACTDGIARAMTCNQVENEIANCACQ